MAVFAETGGCVKSSLASGNVVFSGVFAAASSPSCEMISCFLNFLVMAGSLLELDLRETLVASGWVILPESALFPF